MAEGISIDAQLRLKTENARRAIADVGKNQKAVTIPINYEAGKVSKDFAELTANSISKKLKTSFRLAGDDLAVKIDDAFKKTKIKASGGGLVQGLIGNLSSIITAPLSGIARGSFEGIGKEVSLKLGQGIAKGIDNQAGQFIGSFDFFGESIVNQFLPKISNNLVSSLKELPLGEDIKKEIAKLDTDEGKQALKDKLKDLLGDIDLTIEQEFNRGQRRDIRDQKVEGARTGLAKEFKSRLETNSDTSDIAAKLDDLGVNVAGINLVEAIALKNVNALDKLKITVTKSINQLDDDLKKAELILQDRLSKLSQASELLQLAKQSGNEAIAKSASAKIATFDRDIAAVRQIIIDKNLNLKALKNRLGSIPNDINQVQNNNIGQKLEAQAQVIAQVLNQNQTEIFNQLIEKQIANNKKQITRLDSQIQSNLAPILSVIDTAKQVDTAKLQADKEELGESVNRTIAIQKRIENRINVLKNQRRILVKKITDPEDETLKALSKKIDNYKTVLSSAQSKTDKAIGGDEDKQALIDSIRSRENILKHGEIAQQNLTKLQQKLKKQRDIVESQLQDRNQVLEKLTKTVSASTNQPVIPNTTVTPKPDSKVQKVASKVENYR